MPRPTRTFFARPRAVSDWRASLHRSSYLRFEPGMHARDHSRIEAYPRAQPIAAPANPRPRMVWRMSGCSDKVTPREFSACPFSFRRGHALVLILRGSGDVFDARLVLPPLGGVLQVQQRINVALITLCGFDVPSDLVKISGSRNFHHCTYRTAGMIPVLPTRASAAPGRIRNVPKSDAEWGAFRSGDHVLFACSIALRSPWHFAGFAIPNRHAL